MTWDGTDLGFRMGLSPKVPGALAKHARPAVDRLLRAHGLSIEDIEGWAVHPRGRRIVEVVGEQLGLTDEKDPQPSPREIRAAVADATCEVSVKLYDVSLMVEVEYQQKAIQDNLERLRTARSLLDDQLRRAAAISSAPSS